MIDGRLKAFVSTEAHTLGASRSKARVDDVWISEVGDPVEGWADAFEPNSEVVNWRGEGCWSKPHRAEELQPGSRPGVSRNAKSDVLVSQTHRTRVPPLAVVGSTWFLWRVLGRFGLVISDTATCR